MRRFWASIKPIIEAGEGSSAYWRIISRLPIKRRSWFIENLRLEQTYNTHLPLSGRYYGQPHAASLASGTPCSAGFIRQKRHEDLTTPQKVRILLQDLGPTYVKIGQMASSRPELLPRRLL